MPPAITPIAAELFRIVMTLDGSKTDMPLVVSSTATEIIKMASKAPDQSALEKPLSQ